MVRCFVAADIALSVKELCTNIQNEIAGVDADFKLVEERNFHITLAFLKYKGDSVVPDSYIEPIKNVLNKISSSQKKITAVAGPVLYIPTKNFLRVVALHIDSPELEQLRLKTIQELSSLGLEPASNPAHLTLCRVKSLKNKENIIEASELYSSERIVFEISNIRLVKSTLSPKGPVYENLAEFGF